MENQLGQPAPAAKGFLARNTALNFLGQFLPLLVGILMTPLIIRGLGTERFGILSLAWVVIGYFSLFDLGLGRATTKFVSEFIGTRKSGTLPSLFWTSLLFNGLLGIIGGLAMAAATPYFVNHIFRIPPELLGEAKASFFILSVSVPVVVITSALRGFLEGGQRFTLVNAVKIPSSSLTFLIPALALPLGLRLPPIVHLLLIARFASALTYALLCFKAFPVLSRSISINGKLIRFLLSFGGWITVTNVVAPLLVYLDRFFIGSRLSLDAVAFYTAPYQIITRLWILPMSLVVTLFPVFSAIGKERQDELGDLYARSSKYLLLIMGPLILFIVLFAGNILQLWLGPEFAQKSTLVLQILAVGVLVNSLVNIPFSIIQGIGRPDITAKFHLLELPLYAWLAWVLIGRLGITGAALAWSIRVLVDALLILLAIQKLVPSSLPAMIRAGFGKAAIILSGLAAISSSVVLLTKILVIKIMFTVGLLPIFYLIVWYRVLSRGERQTLPSALGLVTLSRLRRKIRPANKRNSKNIDSL
jgi:O-antigen/teichoic acid export membrane protein